MDKCFSVDNKEGAYLDKMASEYILKMEFVGFTKKHDYFQRLVNVGISFPKQMLLTSFSPESFDNFPGNFTQTYDPEVALLDLVNTLG